MDRARREVARSEQRERALGRGQTRARLTKAPSRGGLLALALGGFLGSAGCGDESDPANRPRAEAVTGSPGASSTTPPKPTSTSSAASARPKRKLCDRTQPAAGKTPARVTFGHVEAEGEPAGPTELRAGGGKYTWVNLWAGWCGPCREEIPLLQSWETKLAGKLRVEFVSVDDDERLAKRFLADQPKGGVRTSLHLPTGETRKEWLDSVGLGAISQLPVHVLLDKSGNVKCVASGSVEAADFAEIEALVAP